MNNQLRHNLLTNIYQTDHIPANDSMRTAYHSLLEGPLDIEALGLSLHSLLVNPALGDVQVCPCVRCSSLR